jgi:putative flippase GtrA
VRILRLKKPLLWQIIAFVGVSGIGWIIDFTVYTVLTTVLHFSAGVSNFLSAIPAITFVFFMATFKTFVKNEDGLSLHWKYALYVAYQAVLLAGVSCLNQALFDWLRGLFLQGSLLYRYCAILSKVMITPITMFCNFIVLKRLTERM